MSAFMVSKRTIDALATAISASHWCETSAQEIGQTLVNWNLSSIEIRYPDTLGEYDRMPGPVDRTDHFPNYRYECVEISDPLVLVKAAHCLNYQSSEDPDWWDSEARSWLLRLVWRCSTSAKGYDDAEGWDL